MKRTSLSSTSLQAAPRSFHTELTINKRKRYESLRHTFWQGFFRQNFPLFGINTARSSIRIHYNVRGESMAIASQTSLVLLGPEWLVPFFRQYLMKYKIF